MNKTELSSAVAKQANLTQAQAKAAVEATLDAIAAAVKEGDKVALLGFGTFSVTERPERQGINPATKKRSLFLLRRWLSSRLVLLSK